MSGPDTEDLVRRTLAAVAERAPIDGDAPVLVPTPRAGAPRRRRVWPVLAAAAVVLVAASGSVVLALDADDVRTEEPAAVPGEAPEAWAAVPFVLPEGWVATSGEGPVEGAWQTTAWEEADGLDGDGAVAPLEVRSSIRGDGEGFPEPRGAPASVVVLPGGINAARHVADDGAVDLRFQRDGVAVQVSAPAGVDAVEVAAGVVLLAPRSAAAVRDTAFLEALPGDEPALTTVADGLVVELRWAVRNGRLNRCARLIDDASPFESGGACIDGSTGRGEPWPHLRADGTPVVAALASREVARIEAWVDDASPVDIVRFVDPASGLPVGFWQAPDGTDDVFLRFVDGQGVEVGSGSVGFG